MSLCWPSLHSLFFWLHLFCTVLMRCSTNHTDTSSVLRLSQLMTFKLLFTIAVLITATLTKESHIFLCSGVHYCLRVLKR